VSANGTAGTQIVTGELHRVRRGRGKRFSAEPPPKPRRRPARIAITLALAHMIQRAIDRGEIRDQLAQDGLAHHGGKWLREAVQEMTWSEQRRILASRIYTRASAEG
jgi:hypothetical protein